MDPATLAALIQVGGSVLQGFIGNNATQSATQAALSGNQAATAEQRRQFDTIMNLLNPAIQQGDAARSEVARRLGLGGTSGGGSGNSFNPDSLNYLPEAQPQFFMQPGGGWGSNSGGVFFNPQRRFDSGPGSVDVIDQMVDGNTALEPQRAGTIQNAGVGGAAHNNAAPGSGGLSGDPNDPFGGFFASPGYQFTVDQALRGVETGNSARGGVLSGGNQLALLERGAQLGSLEFNNQINQLLALANGGQAATHQAVGSTSNTSANISNLLSGAGDTRASGILGQGQNLSNTINQLGQVYGNYQQQSQLDALIQEILTGQPSGGPGGGNIFDEIANQPWSTPPFNPNIAPFSAGAGT